MQAAAIAPVGNGNCSDADYGAYLDRIRARFAALAGAGVPLFATNAGNLFQTYLDAFPADLRQYHDCYACRQFMNRFGGLVTIAEDGATDTPIWSEADAPEVYKGPVHALVRAVRKAKVTGVFLSKDPVLGTPLTGVWAHPSVRLTTVFRHPVLTAGQAMAEKREDYVTVTRALGEFKLAQIEQALTLLDTEALYRSEKVRGPVQWLRDVYVARDAAHPSRRANILWRAVALAPSGFCHPRSSMAGTLLEDIAAGMEFAEVSRRFAAKMHPLQYQRPLAAPSAQNIAQGEKVIAAMGAQRSLLRRFARLDEIEAVWRPKDVTPTAPSNGGVFGHLVVKGDEATKPIVAPAQTMTWEKFARTVLPTAEAIEFYAGHGRDNYAAIVTAVDPEAPPILQWDAPERRNPFSWYVWHGGAPPEQFSLKGGAWHRVSAVTLTPWMWRDVQSSHHAKGVIFVLAEARETRQSGAALFPEILKSELHAVRATIEAYSRGAEIADMAEGTACGYMASAGQNWNLLLRVKSGGRSAQYKLDRWD